MSGELRMLGYRIVLSVLFVFVFLTETYAVTSHSISFSHRENNSKIIEFKLNNYELETVEESGEFWARIDVDGGLSMRQKGAPDVPFFDAGVQIPDGVDYQFEVISETHIDLTPEENIIPSRGVLYRNQNPDMIPYVYGAVVDTASWYPGDLISNSDAFLFRLVKGTWLSVFPFQYNKDKNLLRVYTSITIQITEKTTAIMVKKTGTSTTREPDVVNDVCRDLFINYESQSYDQDLPGRIDTGIYQEEIGDILVIYTSRDKDAIQPWIIWKREKGFTVHEREVPTGANVKTVISDVYSSNNSLLYVQLVGDWEDIQSDIGTGQNAPMDPMLGCVSGNDETPDLAVGRFSASNVDEVTVQINKAINYEKNPNGSWYKNGLGIGSDEGQGSGDDGEGDWEHIDIIKENKLLPYTYTSVTEAYKNPSDSDVANAVNSGLSIINYCGHGGSTSFVTSGFNNSDVDSLTNGDKLPVIISVACVNGKFHKSGDCFAERWLKKENGGAVTVLMSTINQSWTPPMRGQDYMNDLITGGYDYSGNPGSGDSTTDGRTTFGIIALNGGIMMKDSETLKTWTTFGDSTLQLRTDTPKTVSISDSFIAKGQPFTAKITSSGVVENVRVALTQNGNTSSGLTNSNGDVSFTHTLDEGTATLVVTGYNLKTIYKMVKVYGSHPGTGSISRFLWNGINGTTLTDLTGLADYPYSPASSEDIDFFDSELNTGDNYGSRIAGYVHPPETGDYTFWISGDDVCELRLSMTEREADAQLIALVSSWTAQYQWDSDAEQMSQTITLEKGKKYYIEALHKENTGSDHIAVAWQSNEIIREVIPGPFLSQYDKNNTVRFSSGANGNLAGDLVQNLSYGESTTQVKAVPDSHYEFAGWTGDQTGSNADLIINSVTNDMSISATFQIKEHTVNFFNGSNGSINGTLVQTVNDGANCTKVTAVPDVNYEFTGWAGDYTGTNPVLTLSNVTSDMRITANFKLTPHTVTFISGANGSINGTIVQSVSHGDNSIAVTAVPDANYEFAGWTGDHTGSNAILTLSNVTSDMTITATFKLKTHTVTFTSDLNGTIEGLKVQTVNNGESTQQVTAKPVNGYKFTGWIGGYKSNTSSIIIDNVTSDKTVTAEFVKISSDNNNSGDFFVEDTDSGGQGCFISTIE